MELSTGAALRYYEAYWSSWIVGEIARKRTEWVAERGLRDGVDAAEMRRRLRESRERVNGLINRLSQSLRSVDYEEAPSADLSWLRDPDDRPVMQTALAAGADVLVTENSNDFPLGERRNGVLILGSEAFLSAFYAAVPAARLPIQELLRRAPQAH